MAFLMLLSPGVTPARANTLTAVGGLMFGRNTEMNEIKNPQPLLGAEYTLGLIPRFDIGAFYEESFLSYPTGESGDIRFLGILGRFHFLGGYRSGPFIDARLGLARRTQGESSSGNRLDWAAGAGYEFVLSRFFSVSPRLGFRSVPDSVNNPKSTVVGDGAVLFSIKL